MNWVQPQDFYQSTNFRELLTRWVKTQKQNRSFSFRGLSKRAGFQSPNYLQLVLKGQRNIGFEGFTKLVRLMGVTGLEREYFRQLIEFNQTKSVDRKKEVFDQLLKLRKRATHLHSFRLPISDYEYLSSWKYVAIREFLLVNPEVKSALSISKALEFDLKENDVAEALQFLEQSGLIEKTEKGYNVLNANLVSTDETNSLSVRNFHKQILELADQSLTATELERREFGALTLALTDEQFVQFKKRMKEFRADLHRQFASSQTGAAIYQVSLFGFPLTKNQPPKKALTPQKLSGESK